MTTPRFTIARLPDADGLAHVEGKEFHHMRDVLRLAPPAEVVLLDATGVRHRGSIVGYERDCAIVRIESSDAPPAESRIILAAAVVKGARMDFVVEKTAELGADELWPLLCARSVARSPGVERVARWRRLALSAAKQSSSARALQVRAPLQFADLIRAAPADTLAVICAISGAPFGDLIRRVKPRAILIAVGPEGDFDDAERAAASNAGFIAASLGPNRLRAETAAVAAVGIAAEAMHAAKPPNE
jgi:16S rRNA (uracil1498-N3)-methyltransferase